MGLDPELVKYSLSLGVGGVIAVLIFAAYRKDSTDWRKSWEGQTAMLLQVVKENTQSNTAVIKSVEANTRMVEMLCAQVSSGNDNGGRRERPRFGSGG